ncbi:MAG: DUF885 family protein [Deltaproteobacteria bacterium]|nr:DUF885 family protein [Deltaproteobacteria bacterium]MBW1736515.1 DUF885 family protein [Deltaproteobacteria bacterium]MBW1908649.1 DUF885 family protein [Deltaproteobacteria bacterium]MBW2115246.1 DUF885 family protein [Deltaproteobacteria bacterium]
MENKNAKKRPLSLIASDYFDYLGKHLPQQCASDEFYFLPRSEVAVQNLERLDDLTPERIRDHIRHVRNLLGEISLEQGDDLEEYIDHLLLKQSMESFIREFDDAEVWQNDPTLYVKIPLFATDHVISQRHTTPDKVKQNLLTLFTQIPSFLRLASKILRSPSEISLRVAVSMAQDALHFYSHGVRAFIEEKIGKNRELIKKIKEVSEAWERYKRDLIQFPPGEPFAIGEDGLTKILTLSLSCPKSPGEILEIARYAYQKTQEKLHALAKKIDSHKTWDLIIHEQSPSISTRKEFMHLYEKEVHSLRRFCYSQDIMTFPAGEKIIVLKTPSYLQSLRATASYRPPLTGDTKGHGIFYITPGKEDLEMISSHCPYLSAHETYPGHHILDHLRIHHPNPIRRQIESPLFYEGWACYSEQLLDELGYVQDPRQKLVQLQRQLWRCLRAILDVELQRGKMTLAEAAKEVQILGFSTKRAQRQIRRFCLTPGYQLCYFMGTYEILRLREKFFFRLGPKAFYDTLLGGGEIPFHLVEKRLTNIFLDRTNCIAAIKN